MSLILRSIIIAFTLGFVTVAQAESPADSKTEIKKEAKKAASFQKELEHFVRILGEIQKGYVEEKDFQTLFSKAISGMVTQLDPHSSYLEPKQKKNLLEQTFGKFGGLGIVISMEDGLVKIISPIDDTPAYKAGLQAGDFIIKIGQTSVRGLSLSEAVNLMKGKVGTKVKMGILRKGVDSFQVEITRDIITIDSVKGYLLEQDIGYIRVSSFQEPSAGLLVKVLEKIIDKNDKKPLKGLVLDLRNNPGGLLNSAVTIADLFLDESSLDNKAVIVSTKGRIKNSNNEFFAKEGDILNKAPMVVLINQGSASASEIVSGALQDHKRAVIVGEKSFGKGSVQTVLTLKNGHGLKLTTARYYTPLGRSIQAEGIVPDIPLERLKLEKGENELEFSTSEGDLKRHLERLDKKTDQSKKPNPSSIAPPQTPVPASVTSKTIKEESLSIQQTQDAQKHERDAKAIQDLNDDYFVNQAVNALKIMKFWQR